MKLQVTKQQLIDKEKDRIERLDKIAITQLSRECFEKPVVVLKTFNDYMTATQENMEAFMEVFNQL